MSVAACSCELISLWGWEVPQHGPTSVALPGIQLYLSPKHTLFQAAAELACSWEQGLCCGMGWWWWRAWELSLTDPGRQTVFLACLQAPGRVLVWSVCPAQTGHDPFSMEKGQEWQMLLAKAPQPFSSSCFFPSLAPLFWWQQWHLGFVY